MTLRLGDASEARDALALLRALDPQDCVGGAVLEAVRQRAQAGGDDDLVGGLRELGAHAVSDGGTRPYRVHFREPSFINLQAIPAVSEGGLIADVIAVTTAG